MFLILKNRLRQKQDMKFASAWCNEGIRRVDQDSLYLPAPLCFVLAQTRIFPRRSPNFDSDMNPPADDAGNDRALARFPTASARTQQSRTSYLRMGLNHTPSGTSKNNIPRFFTP